MKKILKIVLLGAVFFAVFFFGIKIFQKLEAKKKLDEMVSMFQDFCLFDLKTMDEFCTESLSEKPILILFTHPECDFCHQKTRQIKNQKSKIKNTTILLITHAEKEQALEFYAQYELSQYENIHFLIDTDFKVIWQYGSPPVPSVFLYSVERKLLFKNNGAVKLETILKNLPK